MTSYITEPKTQAQTEKQQTLELVNQALQLTASARKEHPLDSYVQGARDRAWQAQKLYRQGHFKEARVQSRLALSWLGQHSPTYKVPPYSPDAE